MAAEKSSVKMSDSYKDNSKMQQTVTGRAISGEILAKPLLRYIDENAEEFASTAPFRIAEFGVADGSNSVDVLTHLIETVRSRSETKPIEILCNDLPSANMTALFENLNPLKTQFKEVYIQACGDSFYKQIFPDNSVDFAICFTSIHWLEKMPCFLEGTIYIPTATDGYSPEAAEAWKNQAANDWRNFLECRRKELKPKGFVYAAAPTQRDPPSKANLLQNTMNIEIMGVLVDILKEYGIDEHKKEFNLPITMRQKRQFLEPFTGENPIVGLVEEFFEVFSFEIPTVRELIKNGELDKLREMMKGMNKAAMGPFYKKQLEKIEGLTEEKRTEIWEKIFEAPFVGAEKYLEDIQSDEYGYTEYCEMMFQKC